jgi:[ribosomal protein S5]-alanine N-acetyltransferase
MNNSKNNFPVLDIDEDFILRELRKNDFKDFYNYFGDPEVNKYILSDIPQNLQESKKEIEYWQNIYKNKEGIYWAIAARKNNKLIGTIGFNNWDKLRKKIELSYDLAKKYWKKGIMSKALKKTLKYAFEKMEVTRIEAFVLPENTDSFYLLQNNGFINEGMIKNSKYYKGKYYDLVKFEAFK